MSTGPITEQGKARSSANSTRSGWFTRELQIPAEERDRWTAFHQQWLDALQPAGALETEFFQDFLRSTWRKHQIIDAQNFITGAADPLVFLDPNAQANLDRLLRYEGQFERRAQRALAELRRLQTARALGNDNNSNSETTELDAPAPLADPAAIAAKKRTQIAISAAGAISPDLRRTLAIIDADSRYLTARARAFQAGLPLSEFQSPFAEKAAAAE